jgi:dUTP pyrophosphatase
MPHSVAVIDSDYRGTIKVILRNMSDQPYKIAVGDRIAQLVVMPIMLCDFIDVWNDTDRGTGGFGSTGI